MNNIYFFSTQITEQEFNDKVANVSALGFVIWMEHVKIGSNYYIVGDVDAASQPPVAITKADYERDYLLPILKEEKKQEVSNLQAEIYSKIEGENNVMLRKAETKAHVHSDFSEYDQYYFRKDWVRTKAKELEDMIDNFTIYANLKMLNVNISVPDYVEPVFNAITKGSFIARFTAQEKADIDEYLTQDIDLQKDYNALLNRTHVNITDKGLQGAITLFNSNELLGNVIDNTYASRVEELLRPGSESEAWRPLLS